MANHLLQTQLMQKCPKRAATIEQVYKWIHTYFNKANLPWEWVTVETFTNAVFTKHFITVSLKLYLGSNVQIFRQHLSLIRDDFLL